MAEEEVLIEVEAAESVYGDDCLVLSQYPPHLNLLIKPRTADVSLSRFTFLRSPYFLRFTYPIIMLQTVLGLMMQDGSTKVHKTGFREENCFVEAVIGIRASSKYPDEPPDIMIIDSKGLDEQRQKHLITTIHNKARELSSNSMLVALCEEAVEKLTSMNHPDGDCPLCLSPLLEESASNNALPFMKLMSCFHCFHCECIIRWWNWLQMHKEIDHANSSGLHEIKTQPEANKNTEDGMGTCPVCRKVFHAKDIEHVLDLVGAYSQLNLGNAEDTENDTLLHSDSENTRRQKFEAILKLQQENNGLIEPKKTEVLMPGMFLPRPTTTTTSDKEAADSEQATESKTNDGVSKPSSSNRRSSGPRSRYRGKNSRGQVNRQWVVKENGNAK
ncbi:hypothetical protein L1987_03259 [Smallanthus sonchifolius]|uniref:Uncharacterized protein n=1 Tax=Smallanthus sonchifolius TaxID=185202 RepID=A0ACB9KA65_9ASTR|nr:hypothetical protein L1987_03259 [Smallanthus sonchifolius]